MAELKVKILGAKATVPIRGSECAAGMDLCSAEDTKILAGDRGLVSTQLAICVPEGCYGRIAPRSGLAVKNGIDVGAGVIDQDYTGEIRICL